MKEEIMIKILEQLLKNSEESKVIGTRTESKVSHGFKALGCNITNKPLQDFTVEKIFTQNNDNKYIIRALHSDVTIGDLINYLDNKFGEFKFICGETEWTIIK